jgi:hypothetical protein
MGIMLLCIFCLLTKTSLSYSKPVNVIVDTDIGPDCDDVTAICLLNALQDQGRVKILAAMCCTSCPWGAPCIDALDNYYGHPNIPVGTLKDSGFLAEPTYNKEVALNFPHRLKSGLDAPDATMLYREVLSRQPDHSVIIISIGPLRNLRHLLQSSPDRYSPLNGKELVAKKVILLACMGGRYPEGGEWNFQEDGFSAHYVLANWHTPMQFDGYEIGDGIYTGRKIFENTPMYNPFCMAFENYPGIGFDNDRSSWDPSNALAAVLGAAPLWRRINTGYNDVAEDGSNHWVRDGIDHHQSYLVKRMDDQAVSDAIENVIIHTLPGPYDFDFNTTYYCKDGMGDVFASVNDNQAVLAFDHNLSTSWSDPSGSGWIEYRYPDGKRYAISSYSISPLKGYPNDAPDAWSLYGSNDNGMHWILLDVQKDQKDNFDSIPKRYPIRKPRMFHLLRLQFNSHHPIRVAEIGFWEHVVAKSRGRVRSLRLDKRFVSLNVYGREALNVTLNPSNVRDKRLIWTTSNPKVGRVSSIGEHTAIVTGTGVGRCTITAMSFEGACKAVCQVNVKPSHFPNQWRFNDVNSPHVPGSCYLRNNVYEICGGGAEIGTWQYRIADQFGFLHHSVTGDAAISCRLLSQTVPGKEAEAGLMLRDNVGGLARFVAFVVDATHQLILKWRDQPYGDCNSLKLGTASLPLFLKLERIGDTFTAYTSEDGLHWSSSLASHTGSYPSRMEMGVCVCAGNNMTTSLVKFDNLILP